MIDAEREQAMVDVIAVGDEHAAFRRSRRPTVLRAIAMSVSAIGRPRINTGTSAANPPTASSRP